MDARLARRSGIGVLVWILTLTAVAAGGSPARAYVLAGSVDRDPYCDPGSAITVQLSPSDRTTTVDATGAFRFEDVPDGDYVVTAEPECQPSEYTSDSVYVRGADAYSRLFWRSCPVRVVVTVSEDRQTLEIDGRCYYIHSGAWATVSIDDAVVGTVNGETSGAYHATIDIGGLAIGSHVLHIETPTQQIGYGVFQLDPAPCAGDCDGDERVTVAELIYGVARAIGEQIGGCDRLDVDGSGTIDIAELVQGTAALLSGCPYAP